MNSDSGFYIGVTHDKCEDYAVNKNDMIVVCDGCSSSLNSDIGARVIGECMTQFGREEWMRRSVIMQNAQQIVNIMGLSYECLDVTALMAFVKENKVVVETIGDGNVIIKKKDGIIHVVSTKYKKSAPYYMSYTHDCKRDKGWHCISDNDFIVEHSTIRYHKDKNGEDCYSISSEQSIDNKFSLGVFILNCDFSFSPEKNKMIFNKEDIEWIALSSDGLESFFEKVETETSITNQRVWYIDVIIELMKINNTNGKFVQRRLNKFRKVCEKKNWYNADDVSLAVLVPGE